MSPLEFYINKQLDLYAELERSHPKECKTFALLRKNLKIIVEQSNQGGINAATDHKAITRLIENAQSQSDKSR